MAGRLETAPVQSCGKGGRRPKGNALVMANVALKEAPVMASVVLKEAHGMVSVVLKGDHEKGGRAVKVALSGRS